jgi:hypothetical protein
MNPDEEENYKLRRNDTKATGILLYTMKNIYSKPCISYTFSRFYL